MSGRRGFAAKRILRRPRPRPGARVRSAGGRFRDGRRTGEGGFRGDPAAARSVSSLGGLSVAPAFARR